MTFSFSTSFGSSHDMVVDGTERRLTTHTAEFLFSRPCNRYLWAKPPCLLILCSVQMSKSDRYQILIQAKIKMYLGFIYHESEENKLRGRIFIGFIFAASLLSLFSVSFTLCSNAVCGTVQGNYTLREYDYFPQSKSLQTNSRSSLPLSGKAFFTRHTRHATSNFPQKIFGDIFLLNLDEALHHGARIGVAWNLKFWNASFWNFFCGKSD